MDKKDCQAFLVCLSNELKVKLTIEDVEIVREYQDEFPKDLSGMPPERQVEFTIDLELGSAPMSKASYRMAPKELEEMKIQLQELLDLGFIRPNVSSMGCTSTVCKEEGRYNENVHRLSRVK